MELQTGMHKPIAMENVKLTATVYSTIMTRWQSGSMTRVDPIALCKRDRDRETGTHRKQSRQNIPLAQSPQKELFVDGTNHFYLQSSSNVYDIFGEELA